MKTILITGASSGIGRATAELLSSENYNVVLVSRNIAKVEEYASKLKGEALVRKADVQDLDAINAIVKEAKEKFGSIDILLNNAGLGYFDRLDEGKMSEWNEMIDTNIKGVLNLIHATLPDLKASRGQIINLGSIASHHVFPNSGVYAATKHAVFAISESIRLELMGEVKVTTISPGAVNTDFIHVTTNKELHASYKDYFATAMHSETIAQQIKHAVEAPDNAVVNEIIIRPFRSAMK